MKLQKSLKTINYWDISAELLGTENFINVLKKIKNKSFRYFTNQR